MLIRELIVESEIREKIVNDLMDLLLLYRQSDQTKLKLVGPKGAISYLRRLGHTVDEDTMLTLLDDPIWDNIVERSDSEFIHLKSSEPEPTVSPDEMESNEEKVDSAAARMADKNVKSGEKL